MTEAHKKAIKTGTTTVGIVCSDGIVIAADKRTTMGNIIFDREAQKVVPIVDDIVVTKAGMVSETQRLIKLVRAELKLIEVRTNRKVSVKEAANLFTNMNYYGIRQMGEWAIAEFLVAGRDATGFSLYQAAADGSMKKHDNFSTTGSGSYMVYGVLEDKYKKGITVEEGVKLAVEGINSAQLRDSASGSGFDVYTITKDGLKKVLSKSLTVKAEI